MKLFGTAERMTSELLEWDHVTVRHHRSGSREFRVGRRVFAQLPSEHQVDILLPKKVRVDLVLNEQAEPHPVMPRSGWVTVYLNEESNEVRAVQILKAAYDIACADLRPQLLHPAHSSLSNRLVN